MIVLLGQQFRGRHQGGLITILCGKIDAGGGHHGFAGTNVALAQAVHGRFAAHIGHGLPCRAPLCISEGEREGIVERLHINGGAHCGAEIRAAAAQQLHAGAQQEKFFKGQSAPRHVQGLKGGREVNIFIGVADVA